MFPSHLFQAAVANSSSATPASLDEAEKEQLALHAALTEMEKLGQEMGESTCLVSSMLSKIGNKLGEAMLQGRQENAENFAKVLAGQKEIKDMLLSTGYGKDWDLGAMSINNLPFRAQNLIERPLLLAQLAQALPDASTDSAGSEVADAKTVSSTATRVVVLTGGTGVGKSQLVREYLSNARFDTSRGIERGKSGITWWINAQTDTDIHNAFALLAKEVGLVGGNPSHQPGFMLTQRTLRFLQVCEQARGWLLVFDNAELDIGDLAKYFPRSGGSVVVTTRADPANWVLGGASKNDQVLFSRMRREDFSFERKGDMVLQTYERK